MNILAPTPGSTFHITGEPRMLVIVCLLEALDIPPLPIPVFDWEVVTHDPIVSSTCASSLITCVGSETFLNAGLTPSLALGNFLGGDATIFARTTTPDGVRHEASVAVRIVGDNPDPADVTAALGGAGTIADLIARHESGRQQFLPSGAIKLGSGGDVGVMQLCNPAATCEQRWDWRENVRGGLTNLASKEASARAYLNQHRVGGSLPNDQGFDDAEVLRRETIQRYNGGAYWVWDATANLWRKSPPNDYVFLVLGS
jgi:hypothetical protein